MEYDLLIPDNQRVASVVAPLKPDNIISVLGVDIDDLTLTFITPLGTNNNQI
jgi:hypothetical protein